MDPVKVLKLVAAMGGRLARVFLVGCEPSPASVDEEEKMRMGLSPPVEAAVGTAVATVEALVSRLLNDPAGEPSGRVARLPTANTIAG